jgi:hypothetical protein
METLLGVADFIVLLLLIVLALRAAKNELSPGSGSLVLSLCLAAVLIIFGTVSLTAYLGLIQAVSSLTRGIFLLVLLGMAGILGVSGSGKSAA